MDNRLHILEIRTVVLPSAESQNNSTEVSAPTGLSSTIMATHGSRQSVGRPECQCDRSHVDEADVLLSLRNTSNVSNDEINRRVAGQEIYQHQDDLFKNLCKHLPIPIYKILSILSTIRNHTRGI